MEIHYELDANAADDLIQAALDTYDFTLPGKDQSLGRDLANAAAVGIAARSNAGNDVNGSPFRPNSAKYAAYKLKKYAVDRPGELGGQMLSLLALEGETQIDANTVTMIYGTGSTPTSPNARSGTALRPSEMKATDKEKAGYFEGGGREFWGFDADIEAAVVEVAKEAIEAHMKSVGL